MDGPRIPRLANSGGLGQALEQVPKQRCDNLTVENIVKQAASLKDFRVGPAAAWSRYATRALQRAGWDEVEQPGRPARLHS
jgi:hypothetical protein